MEKEAVKGAIGMIGAILFWLCPVGIAALGDSINRLFDLLLIPWVIYLVVSTTGMLNNKYRKRRYRRRARDSKD